MGQFPTYCNSGSEPENGPAFAGLWLDELVGPSDLAVNLNISLEQPDKKLALFGSADRYLRMIRDAFGVQVVSRNDELKISGETARLTRPSPFSIKCRRSYAGRIG